MLLQRNESFGKLGTLDILLENFSKGWGTERKGARCQCETLEEHSWEMIYLGASFLHPNIGETSLQKDSVQGVRTGLRAQWPQH